MKKGQTFEFKTLQQGKPLPGKTAKKRLEEEIVDGLKEFTEDLEKGDLSNYRITQVRHARR